MKEDTEKFVLRMRPEIKQQLVDAAKAQHRSINSEINVRIEDSFRDQVSFLAVAFSPASRDGIRLETAAKVDAWAKSFIGYMCAVASMGLETNVITDIDAYNMTYVVRAGESGGECIRLLFVSRTNGWALDRVRINL